MRRAIYFFGLILIMMQIGQASFAMASQADNHHAANLRAVDHQLWNTILQANVRNENVDYLNIKKQHFGALESYLNLLAKVDLAALTRDGKLAYYINLYNATMVHAIIQRYHIGFSTAENKWSIFDEKLVRIKGKKVSLNTLENELVRPIFKDPRIHVALVCGAKSCPPLLAKAYQSKDLNEVLDAKMKQFIASDPSRNTIDTTKHAMQLSQIFKWYAADFKAFGGVRTYLDKYHPKQIASYQVTYRKYDWALNIVPSRVD